MMNLVLTLLLHTFVLYVSHVMVKFPIFLL